MKFLNNLLLKLLYSFIFQYFSLITFVQRKILKENTTNFIQEFIKFILITLLVYSNMIFEFILVLYYIIIKEHVFFKVLVSFVLFVISSSFSLHCSELFYIIRRIVIPLKNLYFIFFRIYLIFLKIYNNIIFNRLIFNSYLKLCNSYLKL